MDLLTKAIKWSILSMQFVVGFLVIMAGVFYIAGIAEEQKTGSGIYVLAFIALLGIIKEIQDYQKEKKAI